MLGNILLYNIEAIIYYASVYGRCKLCNKGFWLRLIVFLDTCKMKALSYIAPLQKTACFYTLNKGLLRRRIVIWLVPIQGVLWYKLASKPFICSADCTVNVGLFK